MDSEKELKEKAKKISIYEGSAYSFSEGFGLRNVSPYALSLGAQNSAISYLTAIPSFLGNLSQFLSYKILKKTTRKKAVSILVFLQAIFWLFLILPGLIFLYNEKKSEEALLVLIFFYTLLIVFGAISGPIWSSWMKDIVEEKELGRYFSKRNKIILILVVLSSLIGGIILDFFKEKNNVLVGFFLLFSLAFLARAFSAYLFTKKYEPKYTEKNDSYFSFSQFLANVPYNNFGKFVIFLASVNFFVAIASPFFVVYLLKMKGISYTLYSITLFTMTISSILSMSFWGRVSDKKGDVAIFKMTLLGISLIPLIYLLTNFVQNKIVFVSMILTTEAISG
ncbi:MAG: MFS transporter, partial [Candidatus Pacearchaeota archaeon]